MERTWCTRGARLRGGVVCLLLLLAAGALTAQDPPTRRDVTITARDFRFTPDRIEVNQGELIRLTVRSADITYGFTLDEYRISRRVPAGGEATFQFQADRAGMFQYYSNLTNDPAQENMTGTLVVRTR